jgi:6-phosphogluconolactonase
VTGYHLLRMTLTRAALKQARHLLLLIRGEDKLAALEAAQAPGPVEDMPVRALLRDAALPLDIHWTD